ncbi:MAG: hypothetical protein JKY24_09565 [Pseudomonadales bacterium]|nr:hypothetical protein [Pseudomonadales bacterium]
MFKQFEDPHLTPDYYYEQMNSVIESTLSREQRKEIHKVLNRAIKVPSKKLVNIECTFWFIKKFYIVVYFGLDRRESNRMTFVGMIPLLFNNLAHLFVSILLWSSIIFIAIFVIYYCKTILGIDFMPDRHINDLF